MPRLTRSNAVEPHSTSSAFTHQETSTTPTLNRSDALAPPGLPPRETQADNQELQELFALLGGNQSTGADAGDGDADTVVASPPGWVEGNLGRVGDDGLSIYSNSSSIGHPDSIDIPSQNSTATIDYNVFQVIFGLSYSPSMMDKSPSPGVGFVLLEIAEGEVAEGEIAGHVLSLSPMHM